MLTQVRTGLRRIAACPTWTINAHTAWLEKNKSGEPVKHTLAVKVSITNTSIYNEDD